MTLAIGLQISRSRRFGLRFRKDEGGATAVEFGLVALPFFAMLFGIMGVCQMFFSMFTLENAVWTAARGLRTGAVQTGQSGSPYAGLTGSSLYTAFKQQICNNAVNATDCMANSSVIIQTSSTFNSIAAPNCRNATNGIVADAAAMAAFNPGSASQVVLVTHCYSWKFGAKLSFLPMSNTLSDGGVLIQSSAALRSEPYN